MSYGIIDFDNFGSGTGLMTASTKALSDPKLTYHQYISPQTRKVNIGTGTGLVLSGNLPLS